MSVRAARLLAVLGCPLVVACSAPSTRPATPNGAPSSPPPRPSQSPLAKRHDLRELERAPTPKLLAIDWAATPLATTADALAAWARIAPTGLDWEDKLGELPDHVLRPLALALLAGGNFTCTPPPPPATDCAVTPLDVREPKHGETFADPCLRRLLAIWAVDKLDDADFAPLAAHLRTIVAIPPPESELVAAVLAAVPEADHDLRLDLVAHAWRAGQHDVANDAVGKLDEPHLITAATQHHIEAALEILSADAHRATYLAAVTDELATPRARTRAMFDLVATSATASAFTSPSSTPTAASSSAASTASAGAGAGSTHAPRSARAPRSNRAAASSAANSTDRPAADLVAALTKAAAAKDCTVAATAARLLYGAGNKRFVPTRPRVTTPASLLRSLCVLASYEQQQGADEPSLLASYVPARGLERITIAYDPLSEVDDDGDGDIHTKHDAQLVPHGELALPELDDMVKAFARCTLKSGLAICKSDDREFRYTFRGGRLTRIEIAERPPCPKP